MKAFSPLNVLFAIAIAAPMALPAQAETTVTNSSSSTSASKTTSTTSTTTGSTTTGSTTTGSTTTGSTTTGSTTIVTNQVVIPKSSGVIIKLPMDITVDVGQKQEYPLTVPLMQPLYDEQGNEIVPVNTPVVIKLKPENGGARIVAESIVFRGRIVEINAVTSVVPGQTIEQVSSGQRARENSGIYGNLFGSVMGAVAPNSKKADMFDQGGLIGGAVGILSGLSSPKNVRIVQLPGDSVHVLSLQAPIVLPAFAQ